jgi:hypothetical protein
MAGNRLILRAVGAVISAAFLVLCLKALCSHFYRNLKRAARIKRQPIAFIHTAPSLVPAVEVSAEAEDDHCPYRG